MNQTTAKKTDEDVDLDEKVYAHWRHANGVPEGSLELGDRFGGSEVDPYTRSLLPRDVTSAKSQRRERSFKVK